jgi:PilZ domain-containing protein
MQSQTPAHDRRASPRAPLTVKVQILHGETERSGYAVDLSVSGVFIELTPPIEPGEAVRMAFVVGSDKTLVDVEGRIVRVIAQDEARRSGSACGIGVEFDKFRTGQSALVQELARRLGSLSETPPAGKVAERRRQRRGRIPMLWGSKPPPGNPGHVIHVSSSGAFIATDEPLPAGTHLYLQFEKRTSAGPEQVKAVARVVRVNPPDAPIGEDPPGMSIVFESGSAEEELLYHLELQLARPAPEARLPVGRKTEEPAPLPEEIYDDDEDEPMIPELEEFEEEEDEEEDWKRKRAAALHEGPEPGNETAVAKPDEKSTRPTRPGRPPVRSRHTPEQVPPFDWPGTLKKAAPLVLVLLLLYFIGRALFR